MQRLWSIIASAALSTRQRQDLSRSGSITFWISSPFRYHIRFDVYFFIIENISSFLCLVFVITERHLRILRDVLL